jgi:uncharacterized protein (TIGR01777 family)
VLINASAIGWYGTHPHAAFRECDPAGGDFPAVLCKSWEREAHRATRLGTRVVALRLGLVLGHGGLMQKLLPLFRLGMGAPFGAGAQWMSWVQIDDVIAVIERALVDPQMVGAINVVAPEAVTNRVFAATLARACRRPLWPAVPATLLRVILGEAAMLMLEGQHVMPERLLELGYRFRVPTLQEAFVRILNTPRTGGAMEVQHV